MKNKLRILNILLVLVVFLASCNLPTSEAGEGLSLTAAAQTVEALTSAVPFGGFSTPTLTPIPGGPATSTPSPTIPPITNTPVATATSNCNNADFLADVTIPDGTIMTPNQAFTKTWRFRNVGTCTWTPSYAIAFSSGNSMNGPATQALTGNVNPGQTVDISVNLTAPGSSGDYTGYWKFRDGSGVLFDQFYVQIKVQNPATATNTLPPAVAQVVLNAVGSESGTVYEPAAGQGIPSTILAGDTGSNHLARGYMSFDISSLSGKSIQSASLALGSCGQTQDPFGSLAGIWVGEVQYALPLDQADYNLSGTGIQLLNSIPGPIDVKTFVQTRVTEAKARFQIRLHPAGPSDGDGQADYITCNANSVTLTIVYNP